jgi:phenylalanyl-tRNA synthetase beta chain
MRVPIGWLGELLPGLPNATETAEILASLGLGVEAILTTPAPPEGVRVATITALTPIAGRDALHAVTIDDGSGTPRSVVCGAPDLRVGDRVAYAPPGVTLPGLPPLATLTIAGVTSEGMLCSPRELGLYDVASGLLTLPLDAPLGAHLAALWPEEQVIVLELTPNRADAFSLLGVARDLAAKLHLPLLHPAAHLDPGDPTLDDGLAIHLHDERRAPHFTLRRIDGVTNGPSPLWLQRRLAQVGLRPRNLLVDVTNYVTFELGQPSHAYDLAALHGGVIEARRARAGETLPTLAGEVLTLDPDDLVIATPSESGSVAIGLAGVIGGRDDSVGAATESIALEVAWFEPTGVRRSARRHKQVTDARIRFERGVDPHLALPASARIADLLARYGGARVHPGITIAGRPAAVPTAIRYRPERVEFLTTLRVASGEQQAILTRLGCRVDAAADGTWSVTPPSWRFDLTLEVDLIEEVARVTGYEHIGVTTPAMAFVPPATDPTHRRLRERLVGMGHVETIGYVFTGVDDLARARVEPARVMLAEPQGIDRAALRTSLLPGLLAVARLNRDAPRLALFEIGRVFGEREEERLALVWRGPRTAIEWRSAAAGDAYVAKGVLEALAEGFGVTLTLTPSEPPHLHPGVAADVIWDGAVIGSFGRLHPAVAAAFDCGDLLLAELRLPLAHRPPSLRDLPRQPFAERDLAVVVPQRIAYATVADLARGAAGDALETLHPFDLYQGEQVPAGQKSIALRFRFRHAERTLTDPEVDAAMTAVIAALAAAGFTLRA